MTILIAGFSAPIVTDLAITFEFYKYNLKFGVYKHENILIKVN